MFSAANASLVSMAARVFDSGLFCRALNCARAWTRAGFSGVAAQPASITPSAQRVGRKIEVRMFNSLFCVGWRGYTGGRVLQHFRFEHLDAVAGIDQLALQLHSLCFVFSEVRVGFDLFGQGPGLDVITFSDGTFHQ